MNDKDNVLLIVPICMWEFFGSFYSHLTIISN